LATIAAVGSASAQVTLGGEFAWGWVAQSKNGGETSGGGMDTSQVAFKANEDLGNGMSIAYKATVNLGEYGGTVNAADQSLTLTTPMGALSLLSFKPGNWVMGASGSSTWYGLDGRNLGARASRDGYSLTIPVATGLTVTAAFTEPAGSTAWAAGNAGVSGTATPTGSVYQGIYNFGAKYSAGPAVLQAAFLTYSNVGTTDATTDTVTRLGGTYDLGVAKVGAAIQMGKAAGGGTDNETAISVTAPLAANLTVAGSYGIRDTKVSDTSFLAGATGTRNGYSIEAKYNMSKTTYVILGYGAWTGQTVTPASATSYAIAQKAVAAKPATGQLACAAGDICATPAAAQSIVNHTKDSSFTHLTLVKDF